MTDQSQLVKLFRRANVRFVIVVGVLGVVITIAGAVLDNTNVKPLSTIMLSLGGAAIGACLGAYFGNVVDESTAHQFRQTVAGLEDELKKSFAEFNGVLVGIADAKIRCDEGALAPFRRTWYHYHVTVAQGQPTWRHRVYKLDGIKPIPGILTTQIRVRPPGNPNLEYMYDVVFLARDKRLIMLSQNLQGNEPTVLYVFPNAGDTVIDPKVGISMMQSWDGKEIVSRCLLSSTPLLPGIAEGDVPQQHFARLDAIWQKGMLDHFLFLPGWKPPK